MSAWVVVIHFIYLPNRPQSDSVDFISKHYLIKFHYCILAWPWGVPGQKLKVITFNKELNTEMSFLGLKCLCWICLLEIYLLQVAARMLGANPPLVLKMIREKNSVYFIH